MFFVWIGGPQLGIDIWSAGIALVAFGAMVWSFLMIREGQKARATRAGVLVFVCALSFVYRTLVTPSASWSVMYAAVSETTGNARREKIAELLPLFHSGEVRRADWYVLSRRWEVMAVACPPYRWSRKVR